MVETFVEKIVIKSDVIDWYLNFNNGTINVSDNNEQAIQLGKLVITKDDAINYSKYCSELSRVKFGENIIVNLYL